MTTDNKPAPHSSLECDECGVPIKPGDRRVPSGDGAVHYTCEAQREARKRYRFYITPTGEGVMYSLVHNDGQRDHPICYETDGTGVVSSSDPRFGSGPVVKPSEHFFRALGYTFHWLLSYRPLPHDTDRIETEIERTFPDHYPNGKVPDHELWAARLLLAKLYQLRRAPPEFGPIVECCDRVTAFGTPDVVELGDRGDRS